MNRLSVVLFALLVLTPLRSEETQALIGRYSEASIDSEVVIELLPDGIYEEYFLSWSGMTPTQNGKDTFEVPKRTLSRGTWQHSEGSKTIVLKPESGKKKKYRVKVKDGVLVLYSKRQTLTKTKEIDAEQGSRYNSGQALRVADSARANQPNPFLDGPLGPRVSL